MKTDTTLFALIWFVAFAGAVAALIAVHLIQSLMP